MNCTTGAQLAVPRYSTSPVVPQTRFDNIDFDRICDSVGNSADVLVGLAKLALRISREQIQALNQHAENYNYEQCKFDLHAINNTFNFLHAEGATFALGRVEEELDRTRLNVPLKTLPALNQAFRDVEYDLMRFIEISP
jgi:hypothetical protein